MKKILINIITITFVFQVSLWSQINPVRKKLTSKISKVTVFNDRALVTRVSKINLSKGNYFLVFDKLPNKIDPNSLHVSGLGQGQINEVRVKDFYLTNFKKKEIQNLFNEKEKLEQELIKLDNKTIRLVSKKDFFEKFKNKVTSENDKSMSVSLSIENWKKIISFYDAGLEKCDIELQQLKQSRQKLKVKLLKIKNKIKRLGYEKNKPIKQVIVTFEMKTQGAINFTLDYIVLGPSWSPLYDVRVSRKNKTFKLSYYALVRQKTSEDWKDVKLQLSTAKPSIGGRQPTLKPWHLNEKTYFAEMPLNKRYAKVSKSSRIKKFRALPVAQELRSSAELKKEKVSRSTASVEANSASVVFNLDGVVSILSDNEKRKIVVMQTNLSPQFSYSSVPKLSRFAYLRCRVTNTTDYPFLPGEMNVFVENVFVSKSSFDFVSPNEEFIAYLGIDQNIDIKYQLLSRVKKVSLKNEYITYKYLITVHNKKKLMERFTLWDQLPISNHKKIKIKLLKPILKNNTNITVNKDRFLKWVLSLGPGETKEIQFEFSVEFPKTMNVKGLR